MEEEVTKEETIVETEEVKDDFQPISTDELFSTTSSDSGALEPEGEPVEAEPEVESEEPKENPEEEEPKKEEFDYKGEIEKLKKEAETYKKRYTDTHTKWNETHKILVENGLVDPDPELSEQERIDNIAFTERERVSKALAIDKYGVEEVQKKIYDDDAPIKKLADERLDVFYRLKTADVPVMEAFKILAEEEFFAKYGRDVSAIPDKIMKERESELREKITKELQVKLSKKEKLPKTLNGVKGVDSEVKSDSFTPTSTKELFG